MAGTEKLVRVIGPVAVLPLDGGGERYLYKDGVAPAKAFTAEGIAHLEQAGLIEVVDGGSSDDPPAAGPYDGVSNADLKAEVAKRNDGREEGAKIVPESGKNVALIAALVADDEKQKAAGSGS